MGYVTYPTTNPGWEISTILLYSYTVGYVTYPVTNPDGKSQQSCCVPTLWDMSPILQPILMGNLNNSVVFLHCGICHLSCNQSKMGNLNNPVVFLHCGICHLLLDGKSQQSCCVPTLWDMPPIATNTRWEISTILLCSYTVGYVTYC